MSHLFNCELMQRAQRRRSAALKNQFVLSEDSFLSVMLEDSAAQ